MEMVVVTRMRTGVEELLAISYMYTFLWIAAARRRLLGYIQLTRNMGEDRILRLLG